MKVRKIENWKLRIQKIENSKNCKFEKMKFDKCKNENSKNAKNSKFKTQKIVISKKWRFETFETFEKL